jgi:hypothetical protein
LTKDKNLKKIFFSFFILFFKERVKQRGMVGEGKNIAFKFFLNWDSCLLCSYDFFQCWAFLDFYEEPLILFYFKTK